MHRVYQTIFPLKRLVLVFVMIALCLASCAPSKPPELSELVLYSWVDYMPQSVMDAFTEQYGITVQYEVYESPEQAVANLKAGNEYDLVVLTSEFIPQLTEGNLLRQIDYSRVPNFKYVSANFRDLAFDPGNTYTVPFHWGTTGILVRTDLVTRPITGWDDLWDPAFAGRLGIWPISSSMIPIALKSLGYSANSDNPAELEAARVRLMQIKPNAVLLSNLESTVIPMLESGEVEIAFGWAYDAMMARESGVPIEYIIPQEGAILWMDNFIIPANARNPEGAEAFLNFILQPEIAAEVINESYYPMAVDGAEAFVHPEILHDPVIFPDEAQLLNAEIIIPTRSDRKRLFDDIWSEFLTEQP